MTEPRRLLIVEDDAAFARTLARSFERRGYGVRSAGDIEAMHEQLAEFAPTHAVVDLKLANGASGLACVKALHEHDAEMMIVVLTGYASIATAVEAIKLGACHYLAKPSNSDDIEAAFQRADGDGFTRAAEPCDNQKLHTRPPARGVPAATVLNRGAWLRHPGWEDPRR